MLLELLEKLWGRRRRRARTKVDALLPEAFASLGSGDFAAARSKAGHILELEPRCAPGLHVYGVAGCRLGDIAGGLAALREALRLDGKNAGLHLDYGSALRASGLDDDAEAAYRQAIALAPDFGDAHKALGNLLLVKERYAEALSEFERAHMLAPDDHETTRSLALAAYLTFDYRKACDAYAPLYEQALLEPSEGYYFGFSLQQTGALEKALKVFEETLSVAPPGGPVEQMTERALGFCLLLSGRWKEGFHWHERRFAAVKLNTEGNANGNRLDFIEAALAGVPAWTSGDCTGKRVLVWAEQGLGDAIMLMRLLPVLIEDCGAASVSFLCAPPLKAFQACFEKIRFVDGGGDWKAPPGEYDLHCSIMSLPYLLNVTTAHIPGRVPYIDVPNEKREAWRARIEQLPTLKVGLAWAGNPNQVLDKLRSLALDEFRPLLRVDGISFVSLQKDAEAREELRRRNLPIIDWMDDCADFVETAALMDNLDLVISVDTAVAHLAGAIGKPVWLLNRFESEWRWMRGREDSVWYPTMRIFSQTEPRQWAPVIDRIANELRALVSHAATIA